MTSLFWPGDERAGDLFTDRAFLDAMVVVEGAWVGDSLAVPDVELDTEPGGNPVIPLVEALRLTHPELDLHSGLTSQDVVDSALMMLLRDAVTIIREHLARALIALVRLSEENGASPMIGRTLTQWALPITFGEKVAGWRTGLEEALADLASLTFPVQVGGPVGTSQAGAPLADRLGLDAVPAWHTHRRPVTRAGDALVATTDACGHLARDVLELSRPEIGELSESAGRRIVVHAAQGQPGALRPDPARRTHHSPARRNLALCAAEQVDERADGAWHAEWDTLRILVRRTAVATSQTADLVEHLRVHPDRMAANLASAGRPDDHPRPRTLARHLGRGVLGSDHRIARRDFLDVVAWELPGHGQDPGPAPADLTVSDLADRVLEVVDGPFVYAGDSIGGEVGLQLLLDAPDKVLGAVLCCTGARIGDEEMWDTRDRPGAGLRYRVLRDGLSRTLVRRGLPRARARPCLGPASRPPRRHRRGVRRSVPGAAVLRRPRSSG